MGTETKKPVPPVKPPRPQPARPGEAETSAGTEPSAPAPFEPVGPPPFDERPLTYAELARVAGSLDPGELITLVRDGRALVRANAALGLAAAGQAAPDLATLLRDSDPRAARAGAEAIARLGARARALIPPIVIALDGTLPDVTDRMVAAMSELVGMADDELVLALDVPLPLAMKTVVAACRPIGASGVAFLIRAAGDHRSRVRINAIGGLAQLGRADQSAAMAFLTGVEADDPVPDVRIEAKKAMLAIIAPTKQEVVNSLPKDIPDFDIRKLTNSELREHASRFDVNEMIYALQDGRDHVRINAARCLALLGAPAGRAARDMGLLLRDGVMQVRREVARALGKVGSDAIAAAPDLVGALGDAESDVADAAAETLEALGDRTLDALIGGLETGSEGHGVRVARLIGVTPRAAEVLTEQFRNSPAVNVQVNAALGLGMLGPQRVGPGLPALLGARTGGDARTREAVRRALNMLDAAGRERPRTMDVPGFEERPLAAAELDQHKAELEAFGASGLIDYLQDGRDLVRTNAAAALGAIGAPAAARPLGVVLRDDSLQVRLAAAKALDRLGDGAVIDVADDLVRALATNGGGVADTCAAVLRARNPAVLGALVRGLETDDATHARRILEIINLLPDASPVLCDALSGPAVNVQVNAAMGLGMLGPERVGRGRKLLEGSRTGADIRTMAAVREALAVLDGPGSSGPGAVEVGGFESRILEAEAFTDPARLRLPDLVAYLNDGRAVVRANAATAVGALGPAGASAVQALAVLLRDDDSRVRIQAARALDKLGDDAVREAAPFLVGALRGDPDVGKACAAVLAPRKVRVLGALLRGLETDDPVHARRILELIIALPDAGEILCDAFESAAENVQVNAAIGIGMLGAKRAGAAGRKALEGARTGGFARTREAVFKALAMLDAAR